MTRSRVAAAMVMASVAAFLPLMALAMMRYPGGTWSDPTTVGHSFWTNFFCDLLHEHGLDGSPNSGSNMALAGMLSLVAGMLPFWIVVASLVRASGRPRLAMVALVSGLLSVAGLVAVPLTPSDRLPALHTIAVFTASIPGLVAAATSSAGLLASREKDLVRLGVVGALTMVIAAIDAVLYARSIGGGPSPFALPALQKVAAALLLVWMAGAAWAAVTRDRSRARDGVSTT